MLEVWAEFTSESQQGEGGHGMQLATGVEKPLGTENSWGYVDSIVLGPGPRWGEILLSPWQLDYGFVGHSVP